MRIAVSDVGFLTIYLAGVVLAYIVRIPFLRRANRGRIREDRLNFLGGLLNFVSFIAIVILPFYKFDSRFSDLAFTLPAWTGWLGGIILVGAIALLLRAHLDLGRNWSATVRIREGSTLVTNGVYGVIRHPIYTAHWMIVIAQALLVRHWIFGLAGVPVFALVFFYRLPREEEMMLKIYGDEYADYMRRVGGVFPRVG
jgi:protein-S-isoprenylcysteine O-methyltransferase Ste14